MALARYANPDPYTLEELRREYQSCDYRRRTRLLRRLNRVVGIPSGVIELAITDEHSQVRQWIARFGDLDKEQLDRLKHDTDEFVRACVWENPSTRFWLLLDWEKSFEALNHLERLAMVRNPLVGGELIEKIFDLDNQESGLDMEARTQLASAFLTNERALNEGQISWTEWQRRIDADDGIGFVDLHNRARKHFHRLWALASKWPDIDVELGVRYWTYQHVGVDDKTKVETYKTCDAPALRRAILRNTRPPVDPAGSSCAEDPSTSETIKLGLQDSDDDCRRLAANRAGPPLKSKKSKYISYAWSILWSAAPNAVAIALAVKILSFASTSFETIVLALFIFIYSSVTWMMASHGLSASAQGVIAARRYLHLIELLKDPSYTEESKEALDEPLREQEDAVRKNGVLLTLQAVWCVTLTAIALYYLVRSLA